MNRTASGLFTSLNSDAPLRPYSQCIPSHLVISSVISVIFLRCFEHSLSTRAASPKASQMLGVIGGVYVEAPQKYRRSAPTMLSSESANAFGTRDSLRNFGSLDISKAIL